MNERKVYLFVQSSASVKAAKVMEVWELILFEIEILLTVVCNFYLNFRF